MTAAPSSRADSRVGWDCESLGQADGLGSTHPSPGLRPPSPVKGRGKDVLPSVVNERIRDGNNQWNQDFLQMELRVSSPSPLNGERVVPPVGRDRVRGESGTKSPLPEPALPLRRSRRVTS